MSNRFHLLNALKVRAFLAGLLLATAFSGTLRAQSLTNVNVATIVSSNYLFEPNSVAVDANGNLYITDSSHNSIVKQVPLDGTVTVLSGLSGVAGFSDGTPDIAQFNQPCGIVYSPARGGLVVADQANQVLRFVALDGTVSTLAGQSGVNGANDGIGAAAQFSFPTGLAIDQFGTIYIADMGNNKIRKMDSGNNVTTMVINFSGYPASGFNQPSAVAVGGFGDLWVADKRHHVIANISAISNAVVIAGSTNFLSGTADAPFGTPLTARFNLPNGLLWNGSAAGLLVSDTGNNTVRHMTTNGAGKWVVSTLAGIPGQAGYVEGNVSVAKLNSPIGLAPDVLDAGFYVADRANNAIRLIQTSAPLPPISDPVLGFVTFAGNSGSTPISVFNAASSAIFNNPAIIAVKTDNGVLTYITSGTTPANPLVDTIPTPNQTVGTSVQSYAGDGLSSGLIGPSIIGPAPDLTIKAISEAPGRRPSGVVSARYQFQVGNPQIVGLNAATLLISNVTLNAQMYYTLDGSNPAPGNSNTFGPIASGGPLSLVISNDTPFKVQAFLANFANSGVVSNTLFLADFAPNRLTFGFASGEGSTKFVAAAGLTYYAPVTLTLLPGQRIYTLQFNIVQTNLTAPSVGNFYNFFSLLEKPDPANSGAFVRIPPEMFDHYNTNITTTFTTNINAGATNITSVVTTNYDPAFDSLKFTNTTENLLGIGWLESALTSETNLYDTGTQDLVTFSQAHDTLFSGASGQVIVGTYAMFIPPSAVNGQTYHITLARPSATSDGISKPAFIFAPTGGTQGAGSLNALKTITVGTIPYVLGDVQPFRWYNPGDFGDNNIQNNDVVEIFQAAIYGYNSPPAGSAFFDAYDVSAGSSASLFNGSDAASINAVTNIGDGSINVDDVFVTFRRSLDPSLNWYARYWSNGLPHVITVPNYTGNFAPSSAAGNAAPAAKSTSGPHSLTVAPTDSAQGGSGLTLQIPVQAQVIGDLPIRVMMMGVVIEPLDGSPAITTAVSFTPAAGLGAPTMTASKTANSYAGAWLNASATGVSGTNIVGTLTVTLPSGVTANSAYLVHFDHFSASPNGLGLFPATLQDGLITVGSRTNSSWNDGISDAWRLRNFGTVSNLLSAANVDADGDGMSNWAEFKAGTNPQDSNSCLRVTGALPKAPSFTLQWPTQPNVVYTVECSTTLFSTNWTGVASNILGDGTVQQYATTNGPTRAKFYRVRVQ